MMTCGLIIRSANHATAAEALAGLRGEPSFTLGEPCRGWWPLAFEAEDAAACERITERVRGLPGVAGVEVVFVQWHAHHDTGTEGSAHGPG